LPAYAVGYTGSSVRLGDDTKKGNIQSPFSFYNFYLFKPCFSLSFFLNSIRCNRSDLVDCDDTHTCCLESPVKFPSLVPISLFARNVFVIDKHTLEMLSSSITIVVKRGCDDDRIELGIHHMFESRAGSVILLESLEDGVFLKHVPILFYLDTIFVVILVKHDMDWVVSVSRHLLSSLLFICYLSRFEEKVINFFYMT